jgi:hypothetical protein
LSFIGIDLNIYTLIKGIYKDAIKDIINRRKDIYKEKKREGIYYLKKKGRGKTLLIHANSVTNNNN